MLFIIAHPIENIKPSFPSRYSHDLADVLMSLTWEKITVYKQEHVRLLKESIYNTYNLPYNNKLIIQAAITLLGHKAKKFAPTPDHDWMNPDTWFDCSGFICYILDNFNIYRPENIRYVRNFFYDTYDFWKVIDFKKALPGDLVFFSWWWDKTNHIWVYIWKIYWEEYYIHASNAWKRVILSKVNKGIITHDNTKQFTQNPIGFKRVL